MIAVDDGKEADKTNDSEEFFNEEGDDTSPDEDNTGDEEEIDEYTYNSEGESTGAETNESEGDESAAGEEDEGSEAESENAEGSDEQQEDESGTEKSVIFSNITAPSNLSSEVAGQVRAAVMIIFIKALLCAYRYKMLDWTIAILLLESFFLIRVTDAV